MAYIGYCFGLGTVLATVYSQVLRFQNVELQTYGFAHSKVHRPKHNILCLVAISGHAGHNTWCLSH